VRPHPSTSLPVEGLAVLAAVADARLDEEGVTSLVRVRLQADDVELGWRPLDGEHPVDALACFVAPDDWWAVGVAATGTAHHLDGARPSLRVHNVHLVARDGSWASRLRPVDDGTDDLLTAASGGPGDDDGRPVGRIDDVCRRSLGLATAPPPAGTSCYWGQRWLDAVLDAGSRRRRPWAWPDVAALHPATSAFGDEYDTPAALARAAARLASWRDWPRLRRTCAAGTWDEPGIDPEVADWLDDGAFARWASGGYPDVDDLLAAVGDLLPSSLLLAVEATLALALAGTDVGGAP
jgi:hypothetical protein